MAAEEFRQLRRIVNDDITVLGEQLTGSDPDTATRLDTDALSDRARGHYQQALDGYERAKAGVRTAEDKAAVLEVEGALVEARWQLACTYALRDGEDLPERRGECFFNPQHGPARADVSWAPPNGSAREIEVCHACRRRLAGGEDVDHRLLRVGDRYVAWWQADSADLAALAHNPHVMAESFAARTYAARAEATARSAASAAGMFGGPV